MLKIQSKLCFFLLFFNKIHQEFFRVVFFCLLSSIHFSLLFHSFAFKMLSTIFFPSRTINIETKYKYTWKIANILHKKKYPKFGNHHYRNEKLTVNLIVLGFGIEREKNRLFEVISLLLHSKAKQRMSQAKRKMNHPKCQQSVARCVNLHFK